MIRILITILKCMCCTEMVKDVDEDMHYTWLSRALEADTVIALEFCSEVLDGGKGASIDDNTRNSALVSFSMLSS